MVHPKKHVVAHALAALAAVACSGGDGAPSLVPAAASAERLFVPVSFPDGFLWGTASAAYQVEGNFDPNLGALESNWSQWEALGRVADDQDNPRGANFYETYEDDLRMLSERGLNAFRLGVSWERIEPQNDAWNEAGIDYYVDVVRTAHELGLNPMVTFYHWVVPRWIADPALPPGAAGRDQLAVAGNRWLWEQYAEFVARVVPRIAPYVDLYSVTNEPWSPIAAQYLAGLHPPGGVLDFGAMEAVHGNLAYMHGYAVREIRRHDRTDADGDGAANSVGVATIAARMFPFDPASAGDRAAADRYQYVYNQVLIDGWTTGRLDVNWDGDTDDADTVPPEGDSAVLRGTVDWIGINYYGPNYVLGSDGGARFNGIPIPVGGAGNSRPFSEMGTELNPAAFVASMEWFWQRYNLPMYVTENGIGDCDDDQRQRYLAEHLYALGRARDEGLDVRGYFQWSFADNFEWSFGFNQCFGLYAVDFDNGFRRTLRDGGQFYLDVVAAKGLDWSLFRRGFDSGYGIGPWRTRDAAETLREIEAEVSSGPAIATTHQP